MTQLKMTKEKWINAAWVVAIILILFTPIGFHVKVFVNRVLSFSVSELDVDEQERLQNYHWSLVSHEGEPKNFNKSKGRVALVNVWATWCPPCVAEMPSLQALYNDYGQEVDFYFIAHDEKEKVDRCLTKKGYNLPVYYESGVTPKVFQEKSIPATFFIDKQGVIRVRKIGAADWNGAKTRQLLDSLLME